MGCTVWANAGAQAATRAAASRVGSFFICNLLGIRLRSENASGSPLLIAAARNRLGRGTNYNSASRVVQGLRRQKAARQTHSELLVRRESGLLLNLKVHDREHAHVIAHEAAFASCALIRQADRLEVSISVCLQPPPATPANAQSCTSWRAFTNLCCTRTSAVARIRNKLAEMNKNGWPFGAIGFQL